MEDSPVWFQVGGAGSDPLDLHTSGSVPEAYTKRDNQNAPALDDSPVLFQALLRELRHAHV